VKSQYLRGIPSLSDVVERGDSEQKRSLKLRDIKILILKRRLRYERETGRTVPIEAPYGFIDLRRG
jgi:hypothetical protein